MGDHPDWEERMSATWWDNHVDGSNSTLTSRQNSSTVQVRDSFYRDHVAVPSPGLQIQSPSRTATATYYLTGHQEGGSITNRETWRISPERAPEKNVPEGSVYCFDREVREQPWWVPKQLQPPQQALLPVPVQHAQLTAYPSLRPAAYSEEMVRIVHNRVLRSFYEQKKQMIARHHWKLTSQQMSLSNAQRVARMVMKHHWNIIVFICGLEREGTAERQLLDWLLQDHAILMGTTEVVLTYFESYLRTLPEE